MCDMQEKVCLIVPCFNEEQRLAFDEFDPFVGAGHHLLFVNDGSNDRTLEILDEHCGSNIHVLDLKNNVGKAEAVRQGMLKAVSESWSEGINWFGFWDADLASPLSEVGNMLLYQAAFENRKVVAVCASRIFKLGSSIERSYLRHLLGRLFATVAGFGLGLKSYDSQCGAKLFRRDVIASVFGTGFVSKWIFDIEIILRLKDRFVVEYPLQLWKDKKGSKLVVYKEILRTLRDLMRIRYHYL
ncbi:MAG: glycosyltransferase [Oligoflexales bacterium]|nr:glycosyltransferase [Oligoflexales bacterium]